MRIHEQLGGPEPDPEVESVKAFWRQVRADGADWGEDCPDCGKVTSDGEYCGECISERASYYVPDDVEPPELSDTMTMRFIDEGGQG